MTERVKTSKIGDALQRAMAAIQNRRPDEAERIAGDLLAREFQHPGALHVLGLSLLAQGRPREALAPLEQAARLRADPVIETHLAIALRQTGQSARALDALERATTRQPPFPLAFHELGVLLFSLRRLDRGGIGAPTRARGRARDARVVAESSAAFSSTAPIAPMPGSPLRACSPARRVIPARSMASAAPSWARVNSPPRPNGSGMPWRATPAMRRRGSAWRPACSSSASGTRRWRACARW